MKSMAIVLVVCACAAFTSSAWAHPPVDIAISFDPGTKMVKAVITHPVANPKDHYIRKVDVSLNGKEVIEHVISRQDNNDTQTVAYLLPDVKEGDTIGVEGYCNQFGSLQKTITVSK